MRNRKKPIVGFIAALIVYVATALGFDVEPELAATIAGIVFAIVVERLGPVFGYTGEEVPTPDVVDAPRR